MQDRPTDAELADAVREFLEAEVVPALADARLRFRALVAANALGILARGLERGDDPAREAFAALRALLGRDDPMPGSGAELRAATLELQAELSRRIRAGDAPEGTFAALEALARAKLEVASLAYLRRVEAEG